MKNYIIIVAWSKVKIYLTKTLKGGLHGLFGSTKLSGKGAKSKGNRSVT